MRLISQCRATTPYPKICQSNNAERSLIELIRSLTSHSKINTKSVTNNKIYIQSYVPSDSQISKQNKLTLFHQPVSLSIAQKVFVKGYACINFGYQGFQEIYHQVITSESQFQAFDLMLKNWEKVNRCAQPFCGDCSIDQEKGHFSGGKPLKYFDCKQLPNDKFEKHILRTKPGRIDLPENKRSLSLSCSDKIALYNILGIQGKELFQFMRPIYIDAFIINAPPEKQQIISNGINFIRRISQLRKQKQSLIKRKIFNIIVEGKQRKISGQFKQNSPQIICIGTDQGSQDKHLNKPETSNLQKKILKQGLEVGLVHMKSGEQWVNGKTGLPEGCSLNNYMKKGKISTFCKKIFLQDIQGLRQFLLHNSKKKYECFEENQIEQKINETFKYSAIKDRIKLLFGIWTDNFKQTENSGHQSDGKQRQQNK